MNPLLELDRRHGFSTALFGALSGLFSWIFAHTADVTHVAGMLGALATAGIAILTLVVKLIGARRWWRNAAQRRAFLRGEPTSFPPDLDDLP